VIALIRAILYFAIAMYLRKHACTDIHALIFSIWSSLSRNSKDRLLRNTVVLPICIPALCMGSVRCAASAEGKKKGESQHRRAR
jgi:ABC-type transport system involved in cytochrome c biogenesis permease component